MPPKTWADDSSTSSHPDTPPQVVITQIDANTKSKTETTTTETQRITRVYRVTKTPSCVKARRTWKKFGAEADKAENKRTWNEDEEEEKNATFGGPSLGEEVKLKCVLGKVI
jgi:hypothetical protein